jgi:RHS repeat-associated protein
LSGNATFSFDAGGRLSASTASIPSGGTLSQAFAYDSEGRVNDVELQMRGAGITYNANNQIASIAYPAGFTISYSYDSDGRLTEISKDSTPLTSYRYDSAGRLEEREDSNGVVTDYTYDTLSRVTGITITKTGTGVIWSNTYGYNAVGNRVYTEFIGGKGDAYQYDAIGQVTGVKYHADNADSGYNTATNAGKTETFGYDAAGNRNASSATGLAPLTYGVNDINQYTSISDSSTPTYNSRGDVATYDGWTYSYNAAGNLIKAVKGSTTLEYFYDGFGNRVGEKQGSETAWLLHLGTTVLESHKSVAGTQTSYIHGSGIDAPVAQVLNGGALEFVYQDVLGNIVLLANASGSIVETYRYGVWGDVRVFDASGTLLTTAPKSRYLFTGRDYDAETGLYHYRTRAYSPKLGRFMQIDSIDFGGSDLNLYRYVANNPLNFADPLGMEAECTRLNSRVLKEWDTDRYYIKSQKMRAFDVLGLVNDFVGNSMMELWVNKYGRDFTMRQVEQWNCKDPCTGRQWTEERKKDLRSDTEYYYEPELRFAG